MSSIQTMRHSSGFTLIEILVSMVILAIGLLGLASLQILSLKDNQDAYLFSQANALAYDMSDRMHANAVVWQSATLPVADSAPCSAVCVSAATACTTAAMASHDYCVWKASAVDQLANGVSATVAISPVSGSTVCTGTAVKRCVSLSWTSGHLGTSKFELETQP